MPEIDGLLKFSFVFGLISFEVTKAAQCSANDTDARSPRISERGFILSTLDMWEEE